MADNPRLEYRGSLNVTKTGAQCLPWDYDYSLWPKEYFPDPGDVNKGVCRKPDGTKGPPWCYVNKDNLHKEDCLLPRCGMYYLPGKCAEISNFPDWQDNLFTVHIADPFYFV